MAMVGQMATTSKGVIDCYVRNSTVLQKDNWRAEYQKTELPRIVEELGYEPRVWDEQGVSGETLDKRKKMTEILRRIRAHESVGIACVDFGRLSRDIDMEDGLAIWRTCKKAGAIIVTPGTVWHPGTKKDDDFGFLTFWIEGRNKRDLVDKMFDGLVVRAAHAPMYCGHRMYGYVAERLEEKRPNGRVHTSVQLRVNIEEAEVIREICTMYLSRGMVEITNELNRRAKTDPKYAWRVADAIHTRKTNGKKPNDSPEVAPGWRPQVIQRILHQPLYRGVKAVFRKRKSENTKRAPVKTHDVPELRIIPDDLARAVDEVRESRKFGTGGRVEPTSPYSKLLKCPHCGGWLVFHCASPGPAEKRTELRHYYDCSQRLEYGKDRCPGCRLSVEAIHAALVPIVKAELDRMADAEIQARAEALLSAADDRLASRKAEADALRKGINDYSHDYYVEKKLPIPETLFRDLIGGWGRHLTEIEQEIRDLEARRHRSATPATLAILAELRDHLGETLADLPPTVQNSVLHGIFREVTIDRGEGMMPRGTGYRYPAKVVSYISVDDPADSAVDGHPSKGLRSHRTVSPLANILSQMTPAA